MDLSAPDILSLTPREFAIEIRAHVERQYDEYERMAYQAMMNRQAHHAKKLKQSQLFKRPNDDDIADDKAKRARDRTDEATKWLSQFKEFNGKL